MKCWPKTVIHLGANLIPESLEVGEYKVASTTDVSDLEPAYITAYSDKTIKLYPDNDLINLKTYTMDAQGTTYFVNGIPSMVYFIYSTTTAAFTRLVDSLAQENQSEKVVANFCVPKFAVSGIQFYMQLFDQHMTDIVYLNGKATPATKSLSSTPATLDGYSPKNRKIETISVYVCRI